MDVPVHVLNRHEILLDWPQKVVVLCFANLAFRAKISDKLVIQFE